MFGSHWLIFNNCAKLRISKSTNHSLRFFSSLCLKICFRKDMQTRLLSVNHCLTIIVGLAQAKWAWFYHLKQNVLLSLRAQFYLLLRLKELRSSETTYPMPNGMGLELQTVGLFIAGDGWNWRCPHQQVSLVKAWARGLYTGLKP